LPFNSERRGEMKRWIVTAREKSKDPLSGRITWPHIKAENAFIARDIFLSRFKDQVIIKTMSIFEEKKK
jgi:hypothetical protein